MLSSREVKSEDVPVDVDVNDDCWYPFDEAACDVEDFWFFYWSMSSCACVELRSSN